MLISTAKNLKIVNPSEYFDKSNVIDNREIELTLANSSVVKVDTSQTYTSTVPIKLVDVPLTRLDSVTTVYTLTAGVYILTPRFTINLHKHSDVSISFQLAKRFAFVGIDATVTSTNIVLNVAATGKIYIEDTECLGTLKFHQSPSLPARFYRWVRSKI